MTGDGYYLLPSSPPIPFHPLPLSRFTPPVPIIYGAQDVLETRIFTFCCRSFGISFMVPWIVKWGNPFLWPCHIFSIFYLHCLVVKITFCGFLTISSIRLKISLWDSLSKNILSILISIIFARKIWCLINKKITHQLGFLHSKTSRPVCNRPLKQRWRQRLGTVNLIQVREITDWMIIQQLHWIRNNIETHIQPKKK